MNGTALVSIAVVFALPVPTAVLYPLGTVDALLHQALNGSTDAPLHVFGAIS
jgi:hypothetical protein